MHDRNVFLQMKDLLMFFCFFLVFLLAYSVTSQSLVDTNREPYIGIFWDLFRSGLWEIVGEANEQHMFGTMVYCHIMNIDIFCRSDRRM
jgi:hypothetical protein